MFNINYLKGFGGSNVETTSFLHSFIVNEKKGRVNCQSLCNTHQFTKLKNL